MRIAIIPARGGSKRIPRKNIIEFHGKPMIAHVLEELKKSNLFDVIHVSTDDEEIAAIAKKYGASVPFLRDPSLASDFAPILTVVKWAVKKYEEDLGKEFETCLMITPCSPLLQSSDIIKACREFEASGRKFPMLSVTRFPSPIEWAFHENDNILEAANPQKLLTRSQDLKPAFYDAGLFAFFDSSHLTNDDKVASKFIKFELPRWKAVDIDDWEDLEHAKKMMRLKDE